MSPTPAGPRKVLRWFRKRLLPQPPPVMSAEELAALLIDRGDRARGERDWTAAAEAYRQALEQTPDNTPILVQQGHMLKEAGRLEDALDAYRAAQRAAPMDAEPWLLSAHVLKALGRTEAEHAAFREALLRDPRALGARDELISAGAREQLPSHAYGAGPTMEAVAAAGRSLKAGVAALEELARASTYPLAAYDAWRRAYALTPPPPASVDDGVLIFVEAVGASPAALATTLASVTDQRSAEWRVVVRADASLMAHAVAGRAGLDPRVSFISPDPSALAAVAQSGESHLLLAPAGAALDPTALDWFRMAALRTGASVVYGDHDYHRDHWRLGPVHEAPALQAMPDADDLAANPRPPIVALIGREKFEVLRDALGDGVEAPALARTLILSALVSGGCAHVPRLLSSVVVGSLADGLPAPLAEAAASPSTERILIVIPTRDQIRLLDACVSSLREFAERPDLIDILIVDNRSTEAETRVRLAALATEPNVEILSMDEPFNWARLNTFAVQGREQRLIVFANNDIEGLTRNWDGVIRRALARPDIGVVGARLLYGDHTLQHGGVVLGGVDGRPAHEGVGKDRLDGGPLGRWSRDRPAAAVTGAFMAVRRETFEALGGFDPQLAIGYNDIDFCLRIRAAGLKVLYAAGLTLIHHESKTRGLSSSADKIAWDDMELKRLFQRWGDGLFLDPGVNPQWGSAAGRPFDGYREPPLSRILAWLDRSANGEPWSLQPEADSGDALPTPGGLTVVST